MKIKEGFVLREMADTVVVVPTGKILKEYPQIMNLTHAAKFVWELLKEDITVEEIINKLVDRYKIDRDRAKKDVEEFIQKLREKNMLVE